MPVEFHDHVIGPIELLPDRGTATRSATSSAVGGRSSSSGTQTAPSVVRDDECQSTDCASIAVQADLRETLEFVDNPDWPAVAAFVRSVEPIIMRTLKQNLRSKAFQKYYGKKGSNEDVSIVNTHSLKHDEISTDMAALTLDWNASGTTMAVGYGCTLHEDWCTHKAMVCTWNIERRTLNPSKADLTLDLDSCVTALRFNSRQPALLATGSYAGSLAVYNLAAAEGDMLLAVNTAGGGGNNGASTDGGHNDTITCLQWINRGGSDLSLLSCGQDGRVLVWKLPVRGTELELTNAFLINIGSLPRSLRGKVSTLERETGITSVAVSSKDPDLFVVGGETGALLHCNFNSKDTVGILGDVQMYNPVVLPIRPHQGCVNTIQESDHHRNLFLTVSTDGSARIYNVLKLDPIVTCQIDQSGAYVYAACWGRSRPLVFAVGNSRGDIGLFDLTISETAPVAVASIHTTASQGQQSVSALSAVLSLAWNPMRPSLLASADGDGAVKVWRLGERLHTSTSDEITRLHQLAASNTAATDD